MSTAEFPTELICEEASRLARLRCGDSLRAMVLTGSLARAEGTFVAEPGALRALGDAEFFLTFHKGVRLPQARFIQSFVSELESTLEDQGVFVHVGVSAVHPDYFRRLPAEIFTFELRRFGRVVWGDMDILRLIPPYCASEISRRDAWQLLSNRILELLEFAYGAEGGFKKPQAALHYRISKLYLDMATSFLVFNRAYEPSYQSRAERLHSICTELGAHPAFTDLGHFSQIVNSCTTFKLSGRDSAEWFGLGCAACCLKHSIEVARRLWRWELEQLLELGHESSDRDLMRAYMKQQPFERRARGWLSTIRKRGFRDIRDWPRWARLAVHASPRYWIYAAGSELLFRLPGFRPDAVGSDSLGVPLDELDSWLPLRRCSKADGLDQSWHGLAFRIGRNYHELLETTRA